LSIVLPAEIACGREFWAVAAFSIFQNMMAQERDGRIEGRGGAAEALDLNPSTLRSRLRKLGIERP